jgi:hypothetical protein
LNENSENGPTFLKIARRDWLGADYLIGYEQWDLVSQFIRGLQGKEKEELLVKLGGAFSQHKMLFDATMVFKSCREYHLVLHRMHIMKMVPDAFYLKRILKPAIPAAARFGAQIPDLMSLYAFIDSDFLMRASDAGLRQSQQRRSSILHHKILLKCSPKVGKRRNRFGNHVKEKATVWNFSLHKPRQRRPAGIQEDPGESHHFGCSRRSVRHCQSRTVRPEPEGGARAKSNSHRDLSLLRAPARRTGP